METNSKAESAPASDTAAEQKLADYVRENRQHLPAPKRVETSVENTRPETPAERQERERRETERDAELYRSEIYRRASELVTAAGSRYRTCTLDTFETTCWEQERVVDELRDYITNERHENIILYGPVGTGKDHLAFAVCRAAIKAGRTVRWINGQSWFGDLRDAIDKPTTERSMISELVKPSLLCISDPLPPVGALTQYQSIMLYRVVDARYSNGLPTICTVNVHDNYEADERMGAATWDRLCHSAWKLFCNWASYRQPSRGQ